MTMRKVRKQASIKDRRREDGRLGNEVIVIKKKRKPKIKFEEKTKGD